MDSNNSAQTQLVEKLQSATNILVTVSRDPSVDQLAACVGLTLLLNKFGKHATAVFSGEVPSTLEFLQPEQTLEKNTDSMRDFIIALDKTKADKLRYKVEDDMVRIFITPFRVSLSADDLEFSQGDFNVDVVLALGVSRQEDFDAAIIAHGRILHDAVVASISTTSGADLGSINWSEPSASSLSELIVGLAHALGSDLLDAQVSTALLTGIVSETARFSNEKTTPKTMSISAELMAAGANQQLVATKLSEPEQPVAVKPAMEVAAEAAQDNHNQDQSDQAEPIADANDGTLEIDHDSIEAVLKELQASDSQEDLPEAAELPAPEAEAIPEPETETPDDQQSRLMIEPPSRGGTLTANSQPEGLDPANDILGASTLPESPLLSRTRNDPPVASEPAPHDEPITTEFTPPPSSWEPPTPEVTTQHDDVQPSAAVDSAPTLAEIEDAVHQSEGERLDSVRDEVERALSSQPGPPPPVQALGAHFLGDPLHPTDTEDGATSPVAAPTSAFADVLQQVIPATPPSVTVPVPPAVPASAAEPTVTDPTAPPPVPPPIPFNFSAPKQ